MRFAAGARSQNPSFFKPFHGMADAYLSCEVQVNEKQDYHGVIGATSLAVGMFAFQGCFESNYPGYGGYGYASGPAYYSTPVVVEHRTWRDRWWGNTHDNDNNHHEGARNSGRNEHEAHANRDHDRARD